MKKGMEEVLEEKTMGQARNEELQSQEQSTATKEEQETDVLEQVLEEIDEIQRQESVPKERETQEEKQEDLKQSKKATNTIDWSSLKATKSKAIEKVCGEEGICTIVNCNKNGNKRISLSAKLLDSVGNPKEVEIGIMPNGIAIAEKLPVEANVFPIKKLGAKKVIYAGALVEEVTSEFSLDYSSRTSITFQKVKYDEIDGYKIALIIIQE